MKKAKQATVNQRLINERNSHGWSQQNVAERVGTTPVNVSRWERGITTPNPYFRQQLMILFEKNLEELGILPQEPALPTTSEILVQTTPEDNLIDNKQIQERDSSLPTLEVDRVFLPPGTREPIARDKPFAPLFSLSFFRNPFAVPRITLTSLMLLFVMGGLFWFNSAYPIFPGLEKKAATSEPVPALYKVQGRLVLDDPLNKQQTQGAWHLTTENKPTGCRIIQGAYNIKELDNEYCLADNPSSVTDLIYQIEMTIVQGPQAGIVFRAIDNQQYFYDFEVGVDGSYRLYRSEPSPSIPHNPIILQSTSSAIRKGYNHSNLLAVKAIGPHIFLYINSRLVGETQDTKYASGNIGVRIVVDDGFTIHGQGESEATYRNAKVWDLSVG